uniref:Uncharacterized protein n=1 Tax=Macaca fascicularis TaxID=9541 RepID=A0A7N9IC62_MACFA
MSSTGAWPMYLLPCCLRSKTLVTHRGPVELSSGPEHPWCDVTVQPVNGHLGPRTAYSFTESWGPSEM